MDIAAADKLRELVDIATGGFATPTLVYVQQMARPRDGLSPKAMKVAQAAREVRRAVRRFTGSPMASA